MCAWAYFEVTLADLEINTVEFSGFSHFLCFVTSLHFILLKKNLCSKRKVKYRNIVLLELGTQKKQHVDKIYTGDKIYTCSIGTRTFMLYTLQMSREIDSLKLTNEMKLAVNGRELQTSVMQLMKKHAVVEHLQLGLCMLYACTRLMAEEQRNKTITCHFNKTGHLLLSLMTETVKENCLHLAVTHDFGVGH